MTKEEFELLLEDCICKIKDTLVEKAKEYAREDRLHNFKKAGIRRGKSAEEALIGMKTKHEISIDDFVDDIKENRNIIPSQKLIDDKIVDDINYNILLRALLYERYGYTAR